MSSLSFEVPDWIKGNASIHLSITQPFLPPWKSLHALDPSGWATGVPSRRGFHSSSSTLSKPFLGCPELTCFYLIPHFPSAWCQDKRTNFSAINGQFFFYMFIFLCQLPANLFLIWKGWHQNKPHPVIFGFAENGCSPFPPPSCQRIKSTPSSDAQIALSDIMIFIPALNLLNMLRLVPNSLLLR